MVDDLGLRSTLLAYNVPRGDLSQIAEQAVGSKDDPEYSKTIALLEALYA